jgi:phosphoglycolate phosphatase
MPPRPAYQHVIFDFDGTLVDSAPAILATFAQVLEEAGLAPVVPLDQSLIGPPLIPTLQKISGSSDPELIDLLVKRFKTEYDENKLPLTVAYHGVSALLPALRECGVSLHIATNKRERPTLRLLDLFEWRKLFASVYCIDTPPSGSPDKTEMLARLLIEQLLPKTSSVFVGDTLSDASAAAGNDIPFLAVGWGYGDWPGEAVQPLKSFEALVNEVVATPAPHYVREGLDCEG